MRLTKHLPLAQIPEADLKAFRTLGEHGDLFDASAGLSASYAEGTRRMLSIGYRRWLGFLHGAELEKSPANRITPHRVRAYVESLSAEVRLTTVAINLECLRDVARILDCARDWHWLAEIAARLRARATPIDRFNRLVPGWMTLDYGIRLMDTAETVPSLRRIEQFVCYRDGLVLATLSLWPIRRRSLAALTITRHLEFDEGGANILLYPQDTKSKRAESCRLHPQLLPYLKRYLSEIRPQFPNSSHHDGLWASCKGCPLRAGALYDIVRKHTSRAFGKPMGLHDFRRAAPTFLATHAPRLIGLAPGVLQHADPKVSEQHYNLARSVEAARRHTETVQKMKDELRLFIREAQ